MIVAQPARAEPRERAPRLVSWIVQVGFTLAFAVVALVFGLWFGVQLLATQREGIASINRIREVETAQAQQLAELNQRLEAQNDALRAQDDRLAQLTDQLQALTRVVVVRGGAP